MSELGSDVSTREQYQLSYNHLTLESTMAKLHIGQQSTSTPANCNLLDSKKLTDCTELMFPDFWRKTLSNPIAGHKDGKNVCKKKILNEILRPARFKFPLPSVSDGTIENNKELVQGAGPTPSIQNLNDVPKIPNNVPNSVSAELHMNGVSSTIVTLPDFSSLSIRNTAAKKFPPIVKNARPRPRLWRSNKTKSRISSLKDYRSLRNALPPIPEDIDEEDQTISSPETCLTETSLLPSTVPTVSPPQAVNATAHQSCSQQALMETTDDITIDELASYLEVLVHIPKKMSPMAEMMYT